jgi:hypothetical protein
MTFPPARHHPRERLKAIGPWQDEEFTAAYSVLAGIALQNAALHETVGTVTPVLG